MTIAWSEPSNKMKIIFHANLPKVKSMPLKKQIRCDSTKIRDRRRRVNFSFHSQLTLTPLFLLFSAGISRRLTWNFPLMLVAKGCAMFNYFYLGCLQDWARLGARSTSPRIRWRLKSSDLISCKHWTDSFLLWRRTGRLCTFPRRLRCI